MATLFTRWVLLIGLPEAIQSNQSLEFTDNICISICKYQTTAYTLKAYGVVERFDSVIVNMLAKPTHQNQRIWVIIAPVTASEYNAVPHAS